MIQTRTYHLHHTSGVVGAKPTWASVVGSHLDGAGHTVVNAGHHVRCAHIILGTSHAKIGLRSVSRVWGCIFLGSGQRRTAFTKQNLDGFFTILVATFAKMHAAYFTLFVY